MKSQSLILAGVLGFCALFGVGVSQVAAPVTHSVETMINEKSDNPVSEQPDVSLRDAIAAHYPKAAITDEALESLSCTEATGPFSGKSCYEGPTKEVKRYGKANVVMEEGKAPVYVQLVSMPAGAFLLK